jgi:hypothetical protein
MVARNHAAHKVHHNRETEAGGPANHASGSTSPQATVPEPFGKRLVVFHALEKRLSHSTECQRLSSRCQQYVLLSLTIEDEAPTRTARFIGWHF